jgi:succinate-semialdehyde dehydrogenase/glutarate-semialdehyde dehydrogenase
VIFDDVDVIPIARAAVRAKFRNAGQICVAPSRFFVQEAVYEAFLEAFIQATSELNVGNGLNPAVDMGPVATERRVQAMEDYLRRAEEAGATVAYRADTPEARGAYSPPTVLTGLPRGSEVWQEEVFGPIAPIASFDTLDTAIELSNSVSQGLAAYVFSGDEKIASAVAQKVNAGMIAVNSFDSSTVTSPFGGVGESGYGREGGAYGIAAYQTLKYLNER